MVNEVGACSGNLPVSVVVVNYNGGPLLAECVHAALPWVSEFLVVDNGSRDMSVERCMRQRWEITPKKHRNYLGNCCDFQ